MSGLRRSARLLAAVALALWAAACGGSIPHAVESTEDASCLSCHATGDNGAPKTPHPRRDGCFGCHG